MSTKLVTIRKPSILKELYDPPHGVPYVSEDNFIVSFRFKHQFIGKLLSQNRIRAIRADTPLAIISQTGSGKSTLVLDTIRPAAKERGGRILILVSRTVLACNISVRQPSWNVRNVWSSLRILACRIKVHSE